MLMRILQWEGQERQSSMKVNHDKQSERRGKAAKYSARGGEAAGGLGRSRRLGLTRSRGTYRYLDGGGSPERKERLPWPMLLLYTLSAFLIDHDPWCLS